jgi:PAS domain S-box-containing protein
MPEQGKLAELDAKLVSLLEKQKRELVVRILKKHEEVQAERIYSEKILANLSDLFFITTPDFTVVKANEEFQRLLGFSADEFGRLNLGELVPSETMNRIRELISTTEFKDLEMELKSRQDVRIRVRLNCSRFTAGAGRTFYLMVARDMSDVYKMTARFREAQEQLIHSERLASLGEMAAGIGHELTQPLNVILLYARNCVKNLGENRLDISLLEKNLEIIIDRVKKASSIISSLKSFARKEGTDTSPVVLNQVLANIFRFLDAQIRLLDIEVSMELQNDLPPVLGHEVRLEQVFLNILQNAIQSMGSSPHPSLIIRTFAVNEIDPENLLEKEYVVAVIRDNGIGIQPEALGKIFNPFFTTREAGLGMGLGLSIVDRIVRSYYGFIKVDSTPGAGSTFSIYLPAYYGG